MNAKRHEIDEASMGSEWDGDLTTFAEILQEVAGDEWEIVPITDMWNGAKNRDDDGNVLDFPEHLWFAALDAHAAKYPEMWRCS